MRSRTQAEPEAAPKESQPRFSMSQVSRGPGQPVRALPWHISETWSLLPNTNPGDRATALQHPACDTGCRSHLVGNTEAESGAGASPRVWRFVLILHLYKLTTQERPKKCPKYISKRSEHISKHLVLQQQQS